VNHIRVTDPVQVLRDAADYLQRYGWAQGTLYWRHDGGRPPVCAVGAIRIVVLGPPMVEGLADTRAVRHVHRAVEVLAAYLIRHTGFQTGRGLDVVQVTEWNDQPDRTATEVCTVMRRAADWYEQNHGEGA
jgi:hypothetical protein